MLFTCAEDFFHKVSKIKRLSRQEKRSFCLYEGGGYGRRESSLQPRRWSEDNGHTDCFARHLY